MPKQTDQTTHCPLAIFPKLSGVFPDCAGPFLHERERRIQQDEAGGAGWNVSIDTAAFRAIGVEIQFTTQYVPTNTVSYLAVLIRCGSHGRVSRLYREESNEPICAGAAGAGRQAPQGDRKHRQYAD